MPIDFNTGDFLAKTISVEPDNWNASLPGLTIHNSTDILTRLVLRNPKRSATQTFGQMPPFIEDRPEGEDTTHAPHPWVQKEIRSIDLDNRDNPPTFKQFLSPSVHATPAYSPESKEYFSKIQSTTFISVAHNIHPRLFPNHRVVVHRVGIIIPCSALFMLLNRTLRQDMGTFHRPYDASEFPPENARANSIDELKIDDPTKISVKGSEARLSEIMARIRIFNPQETSYKPTILISNIRGNPKLFLESVAIGVNRYFDLKICLYRKFNYTGTVHIVIYDNMPLSDGRCFLEPIYIQDNESVLQFLNRIYALCYPSVPPYTDQCSLYEKNYYAAFLAYLFYKYLLGVIDSESCVRITLDFLNTVVWKKVSGIHLSGLIRYSETLRAWSRCAQSIAQFRDNANLKPPVPDNVSTPSDSPEADDYKWGVFLLDHHYIWDSSLGNWLKKIDPRRLQGKEREDFVVNLFAKRDAQLLTIQRLLRATYDTSVERKKILNACLRGLCKFPTDTNALRTLLEAEQFNYVQIEEEYPKSIFIPVFTQRNPVPDYLTIFDLLLSNSTTSLIFILDQFYQMYLIVSDGDSILPDSFEILNKFLQYLLRYSNRIYPEVFSTLRGWAPSPGNTQPDAINLFSYRITVIKSTSYRTVFSFIFKKAHLAECFQSANALVKIFLKLKMRHGLYFSPAELRWYAGFWESLGTDAHCFEMNCQNKPHHHCRGCGESFCGEHVQKRMWGLIPNYGTQINMYICRACFTHAPKNITELPLPPEGPAAAVC